MRLVTGVAGVEGLNWSRKRARNRCAEQAFMGARRWAWTLACNHSERLTSAQSLERLMMFARLGMWQGSAAELEQWIVRAREFVKPNLRQDAGLKTAYWLVDREGGKAVVVTLWESE